MVSAVSDGGGSVGGRKEGRYFRCFDGRVSFMRLVGCGRCNWIM